MSAERTFALVVGIETYGATGWVPLDGPARDACAFTDWLTDNGVPADNILLFISPLEKNAGVKPKAQVAVRPALQREISDAIWVTLQQKQGDLLYVFWGGHGLSDGEGSRYLFYADATIEHKRNLDFERLRRSLRSSHFAGLKKQVCIVDACADFLDRQKFAATLPRDDVPFGRDGSLENQFVLYAASEGQSAANTERRGALSRQLLEILPKAGFPPDMRKVSEKLEAVFDELHGTSQGRKQIPQIHEVIVWGGSTKRFIQGEEAKGDCTGSLVPKLYDRDDQEIALNRELLAGVRAGHRVQAFVVFGEQREQHESFYQRVVDRRLRPWAAQRWGEAHGTVGELERIDWPRDVRRPLDQLKEDIQINLATVAQVVASPPPAAGGGWTLLANSKKATNPLIVIPHFVMIDEWNERQRDLLRWYVEEFWAGTPPATPQIEVILFLLVECDERLAKPGFGDVLKFRSWLRTDGLIGRRPPSVKDRVIASLREFCDEKPGDAATSCRTRFLDELPSLVPQDIERWYVRYVSKMANLSDYRCEQESKRVYDAAETRRDGIKRTDHIEDLLMIEHKNLMDQSRKSA